MSLSIFVITWRLILAAVLAGIIGFEREMQYKGAGLKTHTIMGMGSALLMLTSMYVFEVYKDYTVLDPGRIMSGVMTGIGILCAGTVIRGGEGIVGLTTAVTLWVTAGIGMAVAIGLYEGAIIATMLIFFTLTFIKEIEKKISVKYKNGNGNNNMTPGNH